MKEESNVKISNFTVAIISTLALIVGLAIGYVVFGGGTSIMENVGAISPCQRELLEQGGAATLQVNNLQTQITNLQNQVSSLQAQINNLNRDKNNLQTQVNTLQSNYDSLAKNYAYEKCCGKPLGIGNKKYYYVSGNDIVCVDYYQEGYGYTGC